jgi:putative ABC transport system permease protein
MFDQDRWNEIYQTLSKNKLRTALTAFGVTWGILMLIIMLGASNGLRRGVAREFEGRIENSVFMWSNTTTMAYKGFKKGRYFRLNNDDTEALLEQVPEIDLLSPGLQLGGWRGANNVTYKDKVGAFEINGYYPEAQQIKLMSVPLGRFINEQDIKEARKICVLGAITREQLFGDQNPLGEYVTIQGVNFQVVGQFKSAQKGEDAEEEDQSLYVPFTTSQKAFNQGDDVHWYAMTSKKGIPASVVEEKAKNLLKKRHTVHPDDIRDIGSWNMEEEVMKFNRIFDGITALSWFVGILTLLAGIIGISNIMVIIIKERTKEIGIRRAIGAAPSSIMVQIMLESVALTTIAGIMGIIGGVWLLELAGPNIQHDFFNDPSVDFKIMMLAFFVLILSGLIAGIIPSLRATRIKPIDALRSE